MYGSDRNRCYGLPSDGCGKWCGTDQYRFIKSSIVGSTCSCSRSSSTCDYQQNLFKSSSIISFASCHDRCSIVNSIKALPLKKRVPPPMVTGTNVLEREERECWRYAAEPKKRMFQSGSARRRTLVNISRCLGSGAHDCQVYLSATPCRLTIKPPKKT